MGKGEKIAGYVLATGNAFGGVLLHGPFLDTDSAISFGETVQTIDWHVIPIITPNYD